VASAAAWIAIRGSLDPRILWLTAAVTFWTAGFDVIYACQDYEFDSVEGLFSLPRRLGLAGALRVARLFHVLMVACLLAPVYSLGLGALTRISHRLAPPARGGGVSPEIGSAQINSGTPEPWSMLR